MENPVIEIRLQKWPQAWAARVDFPGGVVRMFQAEKMEDLLIMVKAEVLNATGNQSE